MELASVVVREAVGVGELHPVFLREVLSVGGQDDLLHRAALAARLPNQDFFVKAELCVVCAHGIQCSTKERAPTEAGGNGVPSPN